MLTFTKLYAYSVLYYKQDTKFNEFRLLREPYIIIYNTYLLKYNVI